MSMLVTAADVSVYTGDVSSDDWARAKRTVAGPPLELAVVGSWHGTETNRYAESTLQAAHKAGLTTATYIALNSRPGREAIVAGLDACGEHEVPLLSFVALDIELRGVTETILTDALMEIRAHDLRPIVYTGSWFWRGRLGNPGWAHRVPLWTSSYNGERTLDDPALPYGPWGECVGHQYAGTDRSLGFSCDLSVFKTKWLKQANEPKERDS